MKKFTLLPAVVNFKLSCLQKHSKNKKRPTLFFNWNFFPWNIENWINLTAVEKIPLSSLPHLILINTLLLDFIEHFNWNQVAADGKQSRKGTERKEAPV